MKKLTTSTDLGSLSTSERVMHGVSSSSDVLIVGSGIAGLEAARVLSRTGASVTVVEKESNVGGRMGTHLIALMDGRLAIFDHAAQFFTAKGRRFRDDVAGWLRNGHVSRWYRPKVHHDRAMRFCGVTGMSVLPELMARDMDVRLNTHITNIERVADAWRAISEEGQTFESPHVIVTVPLPAALSMLSGVIGPESDLRKRAMGEDSLYAPCLAALYVLDGPSGLKEPGCEHLAFSPIQWICDNHIKGVSPQAHALTVHAAADFSMRWWTEDRDAVRRELDAAMQTRLRANIVHSEYHGWKHSFARYTLPGVIGVIQTGPTLVLAGDAFVAPKVEGAYQSGKEAGNFIAGQLNGRTRYMRR